jgi:AAA domain-containing protein
MPELSRYSEAAKSAGGGMSRRASSYQKKLIDWLWPGHFALGMLGLIDGDPSRGKSQLLAWMAGHITTGRTWPDGTDCPEGGVVIVGAEDPIEEVWIPRLEAAGANLDRVTILTQKDDGTPVRLPQDVAYLEKELREIDGRLLAFDPVMSALSGLTNPNSDKEVRQAITPLNAILASSRAAGVMLRHFNKNDKVANALYRGQASIAFGALARTGFTVAKDPDHPGEFLFASSKTNIGRYPPTLRYLIADVDLGDGFKTSRIEWQGESSRNADELVTAFGVATSKSEEAERLLREWLGKGPVLSDKLWDQAREAGITWATYRRVTEDVLSTRSGQFKARWYRYLPEHLRMFEMMRTPWATLPDDDTSDAHGSSSDVQMLMRAPELAKPDAHPDAHDVGTIGDENGAFPNHLNEHLISRHEHLTDPDAHMLIGAESEPALTDPAYFASLSAEVDA